MAFEFVTSEFVDAHPDRVLRELQDLAGYDRWVSIIGEVATDGPEAWIVELRADLGPLRRSKRLRMTRSDDQSSRSVRFQRSELDGRRHANWEMRLRVEPMVAASLVTIELGYDGRIPLGPFEPVVKTEVSAAARRLEAILSDESAP